MEKVFNNLMYCQYLEYMNITIEELKNILDNDKTIKEYAYIIHDKDKKEDGTLKAKHIHLICKFKTPTKISTFANKLKDKNQYVEIIHNFKTCYQYLIHMNDKNKFQYSKEEIVSNIEVNKYLEKKDNITDIINKIVEGTIRECNYTNYISANDYVKNKRKIDTAFKYRNDLLLKEGIKNMRCIYIYGDSGVGKTTFAKNYAKMVMFEEPYITSSGKNPLDDYKGQKCIILDDFRENDLRFNELLKISDNYTNSNVGARFYNRNISECKLLIITSCKSIEDLYFAYYESNKDGWNENSKQLFRRFDTCLQINVNNSVNEYRYSLDDNNYHLINTDTTIFKKFVDDIKNKDSDISILSNFIDLLNKKK